MADLQALKKLGVDGNASKTRELIKKLNQKDETIFNELQDITKAVAGMSEQDIQKATGLPIKEWRAIVAQFDKDRTRIINKPNFSAESFGGRYYPGKRQSVSSARAIRGGQLGAELAGVQDEARNPGNPLLRGATGLLRGAGEDVIVNEYIKAGLDPRRALEVKNTDPIFNQTRDFGSNFVQGAIGTGTSLIGMTGGGKVADFLTRPLLNKPGIVPAIARGAIHFGAAVAGGEASKAALDPFVNPRKQLPEGLQQEITANRSSSAGEAGEKLSSLLYFGLGSRNPKGQLSFTSGAGLKRSAQQIINNPALGMTNPMYRSTFDEAISRSALSGMSLFGDIQRNNKAREALAAEGVTNPTDQQLESAGGVKPSQMLTGVLWSTLLGRKTGLGSLLSGEFGTAGTRPQTGLGPVGEPAAGGTVGGGYAYEPTPGTKTFGFGRSPQPSAEQAAVDLGARATVSPRRPTSEFARSWSFRDASGVQQVLRFNTNQPGAIVEPWNPMDVSDATSLSQSIHADLPTFTVDGVPSIKVLGVGTNGEIALQRPGVFSGTRETVITNLSQLEEKYPDIHQEVVGKLRQIGAVGGKNPDRYLSNIDTNALYDFETDKNTNTKDDAFPYKVLVVNGLDGSTVPVNVRISRINGDNVTVVTESGVTFVTHQDNVKSPNNEAREELKVKHAPVQKTIDQVAGYKTNALIKNNIPLWKLYGVGEAEALSAYKDYAAPGVYEQRAKDNVPIGTLLKIPFGSGGATKKAYVIGYGDLSHSVVPGDDRGFGVYVKDAGNPRVAPYFVPLGSIGVVGQIEIISRPTAAAPAPAVTPSAPVSVVDPSASAPAVTPSTPVRVVDPSAPVSVVDPSAETPASPSAVDTSDSNPLIDLGLNPSTEPKPEGVDTTALPAAGTTEGDGLPSSTESSEMPGEGTGAPGADVEAEVPTIESPFGDPDIAAAYEDSETRTLFNEEDVVALMNLDIDTPELRPIYEIIVSNLEMDSASTPSEIFDRIIYARMATLIAVEALKGADQLANEGLGTTLISPKRGYEGTPLNELEPKDIDYIEIGPTDKAALAEKGVPMSFVFRYYLGTNTFAIEGVTKQNNYEKAGEMQIIKPDQLSGYMPGIQEQTLGIFSYNDAETLRKEIGLDNVKTYTSVNALIENTYEDFVNSVDGSNEIVNTEQEMPQGEPGADVDTNEDYVPLDSEDPGAGQTESQSSGEINIDQKDLFQNMDMLYNTADPKLNVLDAIKETIKGLNDRGIAYRPEDIRDWLSSKLKSEKDPAFQEQWREALTWLAGQMQTGVKETPIEDAAKTQNKQFPYGEEFGRQIPEEELPEYLQGRGDDYKFYAMTRGEQALGGRVQNVSNLTKADAIKRFSSGPEGQKVKVWDADTAKELIRFSGATNRQELKGVFVKEWKMTDHEADLLSELVDRWIIGAAKEHLRIRGYQVNQVARARRQPGKDKILTPDELNALDPDEQSWKDTHREQAILSMTEDNLKLLAKTVAQFYSERLGVFAMVGQHWMKDELNTGAQTFIQNVGGQVIPLVTVSSEGNVEVKVHEVIHTLMKTLPAPSYHWMATQITDTDFYNQENMKVTDLIPQHIEEMFVTRFVNTMIKMSRQAAAGDKVSFIGSMPVEGGYDDSFTNLLINIGGLLDEASGKAGKQGILRLAFTNGRAYPQNTPILYQGQYGTLAKPVPAILPKNVNKPRDIELLLNDGTKVTGKVINGRADFEIAEPSGTVLNDSAKSAVEKIIGHGYDHVAKAIANHAPEVKDVTFDLYGFAGRVNYAVGYRWYDSVDKGLAYYNEKQIPKDVNGVYKPMTENRMRQRIMMSNLGWLDQRWEDYAKKVGQEILNGGQVDSAFDGVLPYVYSKSFRAGTRPVPKKAPEPPLGPTVPNIVLQAPTPPSAPAVEDDVDTSWADDLGEDNITLGKVHLSDYDVSNMTWGDLPTSFEETEELAVHPTERPDVDKNWLNQQTLVVAMEMLGSPVVKLNEKGIPIVSSLNKAVSTQLAYMFGGTRNVQRYASYWRFQNEVSQSIINIANAEKLTKLNEHKSQQIARGLLDLDIMAYPLVETALDDLLISLGKWKESGLYTSGLNSWDSIIDFTKAVRGYFLAPGYAPKYKTAEHYSELLKVSTPITKKPVDEDYKPDERLMSYGKDSWYYDNAVGGILHSLLGNIAVVNELIVRAKAQSANSPHFTGVDANQLTTLTRELKKLEAIQKTIEARLYPQEGELSLSTDSAIREFYNTHYAGNPSGVQPLAPVVNLIGDIEADVNVMQPMSEDEEILRALDADEIDEKEWQKSLEELRAKDKEAAEKLEAQLKSSGTFKMQVQDALPDILKLVQKHGLDTGVLPIVSSPYVAYVTNRYSLLGARRYRSYIFLNLGMKNPMSYRIDKYTSSRGISNITKYRQADLLAQKSIAQQDLYQNVAVAVFDDITSLIANMSYVPQQGLVGAHIILTEYKPLSPGSTAKVMTTTKLSLNEAATRISRTINAASRRATNAWLTSEMGESQLHIGTYEERARQDVMRDIKWQGEFGTTDEAIKNEAVYRCAVRGVLYAQRMGKNTSPTSYVTVDDFLANADLHGNIPKSLRSKIKSINNAIIEVVNGDYNDVYRSAKLTNLESRLRWLFDNEPSLKKAPAFVYPSGMKMRGEMVTAFVQVVTKLGEGSNLKIGINIPEIRISDIYNTKITTYGNKTRAAYHEERYVKQEAGRLAAANVSFDDPFNTTELASDENVSLAAEKGVGINPVDKIVTDTGLNRLTDRNTFTNYGPTAIAFTLQNLDPDWFNKYQEMLLELKAGEANGADPTYIDSLKNTIAAYDQFMTEASGQLMRHVNEAMKKIVPASRAAHQQNDELGQRGMYTAMRDVLTNPQLHIKTTPIKSPNAQLFVKVLDDVFPGAMRLIRQAHDNKVTIPSLIGKLIGESRYVEDAEDLAQLKDIAFDVMAIHAMSENVIDANEMTYELTSGTNMSAQFVEFSQSLTPEEYFHLTRYAFNRMLSPGTETEAITASDVSQILNIGKKSDALDTLREKMNASEKQALLNRQRAVNAPALYSSVFDLIDTHMQKMLETAAEQVVIESDDVKKRLDSADKDKHREIIDGEVKKYLSNDKNRSQSLKKLPFKQFTTLERTIELIHGAHNWDDKSPYKQVAKDFQKQLMKSLGGKKVIEKFVKDLSMALVVTPSGWIEDKWLPDVVVKKLDTSTDTFTSQASKAFTHADQAIWPYAYIGKIKDPLTAYTKILNIINQSDSSSINRTVLSDAEIRSLASLHADDVSVLDKNYFFNKMIDGRRIAITNPLKSYLATTSGEALQVTMGDLNKYMSDNNYSHADRIGAMNVFIAHMGETRNVLKSHVIAMGRMPTVDELKTLWNGDQDMRTKYVAELKNKDEFKGKSDEVILAAAAKVFREDFKKLSDFVVSKNFANYLDMISVSELNVMSKGRVKLPVTGITLRTSVNNVAINEIVNHGTFLAVSDVFSGNKIIGDYLSKIDAPDNVADVIDAVRNDIARLNSSNISDLIWNPAKRIPGETAKLSGQGLVSPGAGKKATDTELTTVQSSIVAKLGKGATPEAVFVEQMRNSIANAFQRVLVDLEQNGVRLQRGVLPVSTRNGKTLVSALTDQYKMQSNANNQRLVNALSKFAKAYVKSTLQGRQEFLRALNDDSLNVNGYRKDLDSNGAWTGIVRVENIDSGQVTKIIDYKNGQVLNADNTSAMVGQNSNGFNPAQAALFETFLAIHPKIDVDVLRGAILRAVHLRTVPAEYWHGRQNLTQEQDLSDYAEPMYSTRERTSEHDVHDSFGTIDTTTREEFVKPTIRKWLAPNDFGVQRLKITSDGTPAYNGEGYHVLTPEMAYSHTYAKLLHAGLSPDKALEIYTLTEHPLFKSWMHGKFIDNVQMSNYGTLATQGRRLSPLNERSVRIVLRAKQLEFAADQYVKDKSKENYENLKFAFDEALGSGLTSEELNKKLDNITADKHNGVQFPLSLMAHVETALQLAQPLMTSDVMSYVMPTVAYHTTAQRIKTGQPFTTIAFDYEGEGNLGYTAPGWQVHDLGSGLHANSNVKNEGRAIRMKNPLVYNAHQNGIDPVEMEEIIKRAFDQKRDGIVFLNIAENIMSDSYKNIAITMNDANVKSVSRMLLDSPDEDPNVAFRDYIEPMFMTYGEHMSPEKEKVFIARHQYDPKWDLNTARNVPVLRFEDPDYKMPQYSPEWWRNGTKKNLMWAAAEYQQHVRARLGMDLALLNIHTGKASPAIALLSGRGGDAVIWTKAAISSFKYTRPNTSVMFGNTRIGLADKAGRRAFINRYLYWKNYEGGKYLAAFKAHNMNNIGLVQFELNVERSKAYHYQKINYQRHLEGKPLVNYDDIHLNLMDFDEQGFHADLYEQGTIQGMFPLIGLAARQIAAHSDEFNMQMVVSRIKADPELANMTEEELCKSDKVYKIMKFVSQMSGQFQYHTDEEKDAIVGLVGKVFANAPRWALSNASYMWGLNQLVTSTMGSSMGKGNRSLDIYVAKDWKQVKEGFKKKDPTVIWQMKASVGAALSILLTQIMAINISQAVLHETQKYLVRTGKVGGYRVQNWEYKDTAGYYDVANKLLIPIVSASLEASKRPTPPTREHPNPKAEKFWDAARPFTYQVSPVITTPVNWIRGKDALDRNLYEPNYGATIAYNVAIRPLFKSLTGQELPQWMYIPRFHTDQWWSWINSGFDAIEKAADYGESEEMQRKIFWSSMALSAVGSGWQYNPEPDDVRLETFKLRQHRRRDFGQHIPIWKADPSKLKPRFED